jgi:hypothetical protein
MKKTKRFAEGGRGRSSYQGNENSYTQDSDMDASDSVDKGAASRRLQAANSSTQEERDAVNNLKISTEPKIGAVKDYPKGRDFDSGDEDTGAFVAPAKESSARPMPTRPGQDRSGMKMPTRPGQSSSGMAPIAAPRRPMASSSDMAESRAIRDAMAKSESESGRAKVREQDARMSAPSTPVDETKLPLSERIKMSKERMGRGSGPTDTRSVNDRFKAMFGMKKGGAVKMASGGSVSSASRRADGIAQKGKTRGKMC